MVSSMSVSYLAKPNWHLWHSSSYWTLSHSSPTVVLGYINNESRRFYVYVNNHLQRIRQSSHPSQWRYVPTEDNPADHASRSVPSSQLQGTSWLTGPKFLLESESSSPEDTHFDLIEPTSDAELHPEVSAFLTKAIFLLCREWVYDSRNAVFCICRGQVNVDERVVTSRYPFTLHNHVLSEHSGKFQLHWLGICLQLIAYLIVDECAVALSVQ